MKGPLVIGLGNPLAGDDGVGWYVAEGLRDHTLLPDDAEVLQTNDLLNLADQLLSRPMVLLIDALLDDGPCGRLIPIDDFASLQDRDGSVHHLPPARAILLLRALYPELRDVPITLLGVTVQRVCIEHALSPQLAARVPDLVDGTLERLIRSVEE